MSWVGFEPATSSLTRRFSTNPALCWWLSIFVNIFICGFHSEAMQPLTAVKPGITIRDETFLFQIILSYKPQGKLTRVNFQESRGKTKKYLLEGDLNH